MRPCFPYRKRAVKNSAKTEEANRKILVKWYDNSRKGTLMLPLLSILVLRYSTGHIREEHHMTEEPVSAETGSSVCHAMPQNELRQSRLIQNSAEIPQNRREPRQMCGLDKSS